VEPFVWTGLKTDVEVMRFNTCIKGGFRSIEKVTVNRSPFVSKKSRDQYESRSYSLTVSSESSVRLPSALLFSISLTNQCSSFESVDTFNLYNG
jgi:hypothetical protein